MQAGRSRRGYGVYLKVLDLTLGTWKHFYWPGIKVLLQAKWWAQAYVFSSSSLAFGLPLQILSRRMTKAPMLLGEPGVGKTAVIEGLAQRIVEVTDM